MTNGSAGVVNPRARQRAFAIGVVRDGEHRDDPLAELKELLRTAGVATAGELTQARPQPDPDRYLGRGKLEELKREIAAPDANLVACDDELRPAPGAQPGAGAGRPGDRPHRGDPRHLRRPRPHRRGQAPGRAGAARVQPRAHAGPVDAPRAPRRGPHRRRHRHPRPGRVPDRDRPPPGARPDLGAAAPAARRRAEPRGDARRARARRAALGRPRRLHERRQVHAAQRDHRRRGGRGGAGSSTRSTRPPGRSTTRAATTC